ncbi:MAG: hypothetical protein GQ525_04210 [Draconibacterium sp.]|nr:hypothetical protein [Draconibacterium sp.]
MKQAKLISIKSFNLKLFIFSIVMFFVQSAFVYIKYDLNPDNKSIEPNLKQASYSGESQSLKNDFITLNFFKRINGWGWGEVVTPSGKMMGVLEHLGEIMLRDQDIPMRFVAESYTKKLTEEGEVLEFKVNSVVVRDVLENTSFDNWMVYPFTEPAIKGTVSITLTPNSPLVKLKYRLQSTGNYYARYIRGPWFKAGETSFGTEKEDAILPGVDWAINEEWTSGTDFFKDPWALRVAPHPNKVTMPVMAVSHNGDFVAISWNPNQVASRWFNYREHVQQPVFASPNFVDRKNNQLMGLMVPDASIEGHENEITAEIPLELKIGQEINFDAELWIGKGNSVNAISDWVIRKGLPKPSEPKWTYEETLDKIANAYNTNFWHEGEGFGIHQRAEHKIRPNVPGFLKRFVDENKSTKLAKELNKKIQWSEEKTKPTLKGNNNETLIKAGVNILSKQNEDGSFPFNPDMVGKDDFKVATSFIEPMGLTGETALEITIRPAVRLLDIGRQTGDKRFLEGAKKAIDFCLNMQRPEAGDYWETPLHAANLLAAGHAANANYLAFEEFGDEKYKEKAIYWMRTLFAFTHLWEPKNIPMLYNTKPVLSSSDWYFANWVRDHVQWEVLAVFAESAKLNIHWKHIDPEIDWLSFQKGITNAAIRWINVHTDKNWFPHNLPESKERYNKGEYDYCFPDTHNSTTGNYGGMMIMPGAIADNIYAVLDEQN